LLGELIKKCTISGYSGSGLTMVKGAKIFTQKGIIFIQHYETIIFAYDSNKGICEADLDCSMTSNRQIRFALDHFGIVPASVINTHEGDKWNHSGSLY